MGTNRRNLGERAIVLGGGIVGTLVARVLADYFEHVTVLERDDQMDGHGFRRSVPQAKLAHFMLRGGLNAMNTLFPGFEQELLQHGAVPSRPMRDLLTYDQFGAWPQSDLGPEVPLQSRPLIERGLRRQLAAVRNVKFSGGATVTDLIAKDDRIVGVSCRNADGTQTRELADLVVDAMGRSTHTPEWLRRIGFAAPEETRVEVDISYAGCFVQPKRMPARLGALVAEPPPHGRFGGVVYAQEGNRMIVALDARGRGTPLADDYDGLLAQAERLPHPAVFELMRDAEPISPIARFGFPASIQRHYERLERVPAGLLCIGDAICSFNPVWGQGMSVAALEVVALGAMLAERAGSAAPLEGIAPAFFAEAARVTATPWSLSVAPDLAFDTTRSSHAMEELKAGRGAMRALGKLAHQDPEVRALVTEVFHLLKPREVLFNPELIARVVPLMAAS